MMYFITINFYPQQTMVCTFNLLVSGQKAHTFSIYIIVCLFQINKALTNQAGDIYNSQAQMSLNVVTSKYFNIAA